jgi:hypothetical protein
MMVKFLRQNSRQFPYDGYYVFPSNEKCAKLLEIIPRRGPQCFPNFVSKIRKDYSWIAEKLDKELTKERKNLLIDIIVHRLNFPRY